MCYQHLSKDIRLKSNLDMTVMEKGTDKRGGVEVCNYLGGG